MRPMLRPSIPTPAPASVASAVQRLAVIARDGAALRLLLPQAVATVARRHAVLLLAPGLAADELEAFRAAGVEAQSLPEAPLASRWFPDRSFRKQLSRSVADWQATAVLAEGLAMISLAAGVAADAGVRRVIPALLSERVGSLDRVQLQSAFRAVLDLAPAIIVPDPEARRALVDALGAEIQSRAHVIAPSTVACAADRRRTAAGADRWNDFRSYRGRGKCWPCAV